MCWDYYVHIYAPNPQGSTTIPVGLTSGFVDEVSVSFYARNKEHARKRYIREARKNFQTPKSIIIAPDFSSIPSSHWLAFQVDFELLTPWYSRDDRVFHVMDNPVRKDRVFGVPFMAASSWKGMLRWACRMQAGLQDHLAQHGGKLDGWQDPDWIQHLFGNEKGETEHFQRGALVFYPTWFNRIGFEVINPHSRVRRAGTQPIYYEVVPPKAQGTLSLLYAPWPGMKPEIEPREELPKLLEAIEDLLTIYGISAKRTVGWGTARITQWKAFHKTHDSVEETNREDLWNTIQNWLSS